MTVLSTDLVGSTLLNQRLGDEAATAVERELAALAQLQVDRHRGVLIKDTGDGLMVAFQSARRAVACAQEIQRGIAQRNRNRSRVDGAVQLRIGLHTGEVLTEDGVLHGETLIIAKRVESVASPGKIFASNTVHGVLGTARGELIDRGEFTLKGIDALWRVWEVPWAEDDATGVLPAMERTPFVGRVRERARLLQGVERARRGEGALLMVGGEAGVGKSRLVEEVATEAQRLGMRVLTGHCVDQQGAPPYLPIIEQIEDAARQVSAEVLRHALGENAPEVAQLMPELRLRYPDMPEPVTLPPEQERRHLLHGVCEFIERAARQTPLLLVFEDLHWADESTLLLLQHVVPRLAAVPVLVVVTFRDNEVLPGRPLAGVLPALLRQRTADELILRRLTEQDVATILTALAGSTPPPEVVSLVFAETEGNAFFVEELFRHLHEADKLFDSAGRWQAGMQIAETEVPRTVGLVIGQRLERVSDDCRRILTAAAVAGKTFSFDLLAVFQGIQEDDLLDGLEEAAAATLIEDVSTPREARYAFVHEQIRQTLLSLVSTARRQRLHLHLADALEKLHGADAERFAPGIAHHLYQAGGMASGERTVGWLRRAAERALEALAFEDALRDLDQAGGVLAAVAVDAALALLRARALRGLGRIDDALAALTAAIHVARSDEERNAVLQARAWLMLDLFRGREALADLEPLLANARAAGKRAREVELLLMRSRGLYILSLDQPGYADKTRSSYEEAYALACELGDKRAMCQALIPTANFTDYWDGYRAQAIANNDEARALAAELGDEELQLDAEAVQVSLLTFAQSHANALELRKRLQARRDPLRLKEHLFRLMWHHYRRAEFTQCVATCDEGIALAEQLGSPPVQYASIKGMALTDLGCFDEAWVSFQKEVADERHPFGRCMREFGVAIWLDALNALDRAEPAAKAVLDEAGRLSRVWMQRPMLDLLALIAARLGHEGAALTTWVQGKSAQLGFKLSGLTRAEGALAAGDFGAALAIAEQCAEDSGKNGFSRHRIIALELGLRALVRMERWDDVLARADGALREADATGFRTRHWRMLALCARARNAKGDHSGALGDRAAACALLDDMAARIADPVLRAAFEADPPIAELRSRSWAC